MGYPAQKNLAVYQGDDSKWPIQIRRAQEFDDGVVAEASVTLTSATAAFVAADVGRSIRVYELTTTIAAVVSATEIELATAATVSGTVTFYLWRPLDLTNYTLTAVARTSRDTVSPIIATFTLTITDAANGRFDLILPKTESVNIKTRLFWDLQTVDGSNGDWTETILVGMIAPENQITE